MKKTMNILEFYEFLKKTPHKQYEAVLNDFNSAELFKCTSAGFISILSKGYTCRLADTFTIDISDFIPKWDDLKEVEYFGKKFLVPEDTKWLAVDSSGLLHAYKAKDAPLAWGSCFSSYADYISIAFLEYDGDWTKSLVEV